MNETEEALVAAEQEAARVHGKVDEDWQAVDAEWRAKRAAARDNYLEAHAALEQYRRGNTDPDRPGAQIIRHVTSEPEPEVQS